MRNKNNSNWPVFLIAGILATIFTFLLLFAFVSIGLSVSKRYQTAKANRKQLSMGTAGGTVKIQPTGLDVYDYTFIGEVIGKDRIEAEKWIKLYYPGSNIEKEVLPTMTKNADSYELWTVTSSVPMNSISIGGYVYGYERLDIQLRNGQLDYISFVNPIGDMYAFNDVYNELSAIYGQQQLYVPDTDFLSKLLEPDYEYLSYSWMSWDFDGTYTMFLIRAVYTNSESISIKFNHS